MLRGLTGLVRQAADGDRNQGAFVFESHGPLTRRVVPDCVELWVVRRVRQGTSGFYWRRFTDGQPDVMGHGGGGRNCDWKNHCVARNGLLILRLASSNSTGCGPSRARFLAIDKKQARSGRISEGIRS
jgi:hypothetical protein